MLVDLWVDQTRITRESTCNCYRQYGRFYPRILGSFTRLSAWTCPSNAWSGFSVLKFLHPAADCHLHHLQARTVDLLDQAKDGREHIRVLKIQTFQCICIGPDNSMIISLTNTNFICHMQRSFTGSLLGTAIYRFLGPDRIVLQPKFTASSIWWDLTLFLGLTG